ncbi:hypothetical protein C8R32_10830 [Nitrosospira sp. Nsp5]|uniref:Uncharacterized protein n=1 Tax=Nitrosospira multiformis TaxID=1231 RepID=A0ABY0T6F8_9PROT|nr:MULTISPECIES: hypothetical protein [Nitrosospira]PTR07075.1 hypothetical protein C8R32_10830 [Nitrosospira sp. Nsp5]SDQ33044.1 hypothetical protein SAMN05216402_0408 [Nitrosospira multiformis]
MNNNDGDHSAEEALKNYRNAATRIREGNGISAEDIDELIMLLSVFVDHPESDEDARLELVKEHQQIYERFYEQNNA